MISYKVSVCIPTYNCENYISETIESVLAQNFSDFELLIIDNCSKDQTAHIVESYGKQDQRIRFIAHEQNIGMLENWNSCLEQAKGEYIKFLFADDLLASPDAIGRMVSLLDCDDTVSLACSARNIIDESSRVKKIASHFNTGIMTGIDVINYCLINKGNYIGEPSNVMFRKCQVKRGFSSAYKVIIDLEMWFHLLEQGSFAYINEPLCSFRVHDQQLTAKVRDTPPDLKDAIHLLDDYFERDYVRISRFMKNYIRYDSVYEIWKLHKKNKFSRVEATELINSISNFSHFRFWYPFYKILKPFFKQYRKHFLKPNIGSGSVLG